MSMQSLLVWVIVGGIAGWLASLALRGTGLGLLGDIVVGIVGAVLGTWLLSALLPGAVSVTGFNLTSILVAFFGAIVLLLIVRALHGYRGRAPYRRRVRY
jgi:uncharacterized membrane protein YeaQ/YmgE (transglycosylase-associated protein family)